MPRTMLTEKGSQAPATYALLRKQVKEVLLRGRERIEQEKVKTYWETGRLISQHVLAHKGRADYGKEIVLRLAEDLEIHESVLRRTVQFAEAFPIPATWRKLTWSHFRSLMTIPDPKTRLALINKADRLEWTTRDLEENVRKVIPPPKRGKPEKAPALTSPKLGSLYTYRIVSSEIIHWKRPEQLVDLGFATYLDFERFESKLGSGDIAVSSKDETGIYSLKKAENQNLESLFTYKAYVERVIDGDTLKVQIDLGFDIWTRQSIRLRAIDAPEIDTKEGKRAKEFVMRELKEVPFITLKSTRSDKYDRYLADIFYNDNLYLNQRLLDEGHAVLV